MMVLIALFGLVWLAAICFIVFMAVKATPLVLKALKRLANG